MICFIVLCIVPYTIIGQIPMVSSEDVEVPGNDAEAAGDIVEAAVPVVGSVNFSGLAKASGKVTIVGSTEPSFDFPFISPPRASTDLHPEEEQIFYEYPGSTFPTLDHGSPQFYMPPPDPAHMIPAFSSIPYGGPMFDPSFVPMHQPHFIDVYEPAMSPTMIQPQFIEILDPTFDPMFGHPQFIEIIEPHFGGHPMFVDPFYGGFDMPYGCHAGYPFMPQSNVEMVPVLVEFDVADPMFGQMLGHTDHSISDTGKTNAKRSTQLVPVSGKVTIVGNF